MLCLSKTYPGRALPVEHLREVLASGAAAATVGPITMMSFAIYEAYLGVFMERHVGTPCTCVDT